MRNILPLSSTRLLRLYKRFRREIEAMRRLRHPNILTLIGYSDEGETGLTMDLGIVTELFKGNLNEHIKTDHFLISEKLNIVCTPYCFIGLPY